LPRRHEDGAAALIEVCLTQRERFVDAQPRAPEHDDERAQPRPVDVAAGVSHDGDDLGDGGRVGWIALALVARRAARVEPGHGQWRSRATRGIEEHLGHNASPLAIRGRRGSRSLAVRSASPSGMEGSSGQERIARCLP
jgi:hypothetical protein